MGKRARMGQHASHGRGGQPSPAAGAAIAAAVASAAMAGCSALLWTLLPQGTAVLLPLVVMPFAVACATWLVAQQSFQASLAPAVESLERFAAQDLSTPTILAATAETAALAVALERCRMALAEQQRPAKMHAAVARVMGLAIARLAEGDLSARITVDLPAPYQSFRDDFNTAMERLQNPSQDAGGRIGERARDIREAADELRRRAAKLAERIEADLATIAAETTEADEALALAAHTLGGAGVAARRNIEAADRFATLARLVEEEAERLAGPGAEPQIPVLMPRANVPPTIGATALKLVDRPSR